MDNQERLCREWDVEGNLPLRFEDMSRGSSREVFWICERGHRWKARYSNRSNGANCPYCSGKKVLPGFNDLETRFPAVASEWHPTLNAQSPHMIAAHSNAYAWWRCALGHEWRAKINNRTTKGNQCPTCKRKEVAVGENDLKTQYPDIAKQWHPTRNRNLNPAEVLPQSNRKVWWICERQHEWEAKIYHRVNGTGCPYCNGKMAIQGENDLVTVAPHIAKQWHPTLNKDRSPAEYTVHSHEEVWWVCEAKHVWKARITDRNKSGCPVCGRRSLWKGHNDLVSVSPTVAKEWCYEMNGNTLPEDVAAHSNIAYYWICDKEHIWKATPNNRTNGTGCPFCNRHKFLPENSLSAIFPAIAEEWNYERNSKSPTEVTPYCNDRYWWRCKKGHEWEAVVSNRAKGDTCPFCVGKRAISGENDLETLYPQIAHEWNFERNEKKPREYLPKSNEKVWWRCEAGHEWMSSIATRTAGGRCPRCNRRRFRKNNLI